MTQKELKQKLSEIGFSAKFLDGEIEIYPKGDRGSESYFTNCADDALSTARADRKRRNIKYFLLKESGELEEVINVERDGGDENYCPEQDQWFYCQGKFNGNNYYTTIVDLYTNYQP